MNTLHAAEFIDGSNSETIVDIDKDILTNLLTIPGCRLFFISAQFDSEILKLVP